MATPRHQRKPAHLWPFAAILGPMLLLAVMAAWTLRADRRSVEQEARSRAAELAASMLAAAEAALNVVEFGTNGFSVTQGRDIFIVNNRLELVSPKPWAWPPVPAPITPDELAALGPNRLALWHTAEIALAGAATTGRLNVDANDSNPVELY
jgi:hypothetical protein